MVAPTVATATASLPPAALGASAGFEHSSSTSGGTSGAAPSLIVAGADSGSLKQHNTTQSRNPNLELLSGEVVRAGDSKWYGPRPEAWWTGLHPEKAPGFANGVLSSLRAPNLATCTRAEVRAYFDNGWAICELLFSALQGEQSFVRPPWHMLRHPMIFYYAHPAALYINKLRVAGVLCQPIDEYFEQLFETGVDEMSWDDMSKNEMTWPRVDEVTEYRRKVYAAITQLIETHPGLADGHAPITMDSQLWALFLGFEHERIHIETSSVLMRELPIQMLRKPQFWPEIHPSAAEPTMNENALSHKNPFVAVRAGHAQLGKPADWPSFGWDNEYGSRRVAVGDFAAQQFLVSNGEFLRFVIDGGYRERKYWSELGWKWRGFHNAKWPTFWVANGPQGLNAFLLRTLFEIVPLPLSWPVVVNYHEAKAYAAWAAARDGRPTPYRLISEAEHFLIRDKSQQTHTEHSADIGIALGGHEARESKSFNVALAWSSESPVDAHTASSSGHHDVFGNVWQWTEDHFNPLEGAKVHPYYEDFSTPCYDGEHQMIMGGSWISTGDESSIFARFHFRPHFHQHAGFRLVDSTDPKPLGPAKLLDKGSNGSGVYETDDSVNQYLGLHFGSAADQMPWSFGPTGALSFPQRCSQILNAAAARLGIPTDRALDVGCAVGASTFELARTFTSVIGVDLSERFIQTAEALKHSGAIEYYLRFEGRNGEQRRAVVPAEIPRSNVHFRRADAQCLPAEWEGFDAVLMANLIDRLPSPKSALGRLCGPRGLVRPGGLLLITSPYTWMTDFTPEESWLGGTRGVGTLDALKNVLGSEYELLSVEDLPLIIREHYRKYQLCVAQGSLWRRKSGSGSGSPSGSPSKC